MDPVTVEQMYGWQTISQEAVQSILDRSLHPRPSTSLFDTVAAIGIGPEHRVLDIGARDARHSLTLATRFGCKVTAVEPVQANLEAGRLLLAESEHGDRVELLEGQIERIPAGDYIFDLVFCRDVLSHVPELAPALEECNRVLVDGGRMVIYQTFATDRMEPKEAADIYASLAVVPGSMEPARLEDGAPLAGFEVETVDIIGSEWREAWEEDGSGRTSHQMLHAARLLRGAEDLRAELGDLDYRIELGNALWGVYQMIGKLEPRIYTLRKV